ncbi:MAG: hypothetical protein QMD77_03565 [Patescibacteria group bacterium]|nr:hypothetical protein [Patescibacteria group bacterium]
MSSSENSFQPERGSEVSSWYIVFSILDKEKFPFEGNFSFGALGFDKKTIITYIFIIKKAKGGRDMNEFMLFLETEAVESVFKRLEMNPGFVDLELPRLKEQNPAYFTFFDHFSQDGKNCQAVFSAAVLTYLSFEEQLKLLRKRGRTNLADLPRITNSVLDSLAEDIESEDSWGKIVLKSMADQNSHFLEFVIRFSSSTKDAEAVARCFLFAYGLISLQLGENKETHFAVPHTYLQR